MNPLSLSARNFRSFPELDLELPEGLLAIVGPNGAGKSSIVNLIELCIFGPEGRSLAPFYSDDGHGEMVLRLYFEHEGADYKIVRIYSPSGRGKTTLDFMGAPEIGPLTRETQAETQVAIEKTIGLTRETFRASAFLAQGDGAAFSEAPPKDRKAILAEVLGLEVWDVLAEAVRRDRKAADFELAVSGREIDQAIAALERKPAVEAELYEAAVALKQREGSFADARKGLERLRQQVERDRRDREQIGPLRVIRGALEDKYHGLEDQGRRALLEQKAIEAEHEALSALPDEQTVGELLRAQELMRQISTMPVSPADVSAERCPTCGQSIHAEAAEKVHAAAAEAHAKTTLLNGILAALKVDVSAVDELLAQARTGKVRREALHRRMESAPPAVEAHKLDEAWDAFFKADADVLVALRTVRSDSDMEALDEQLRARGEAVVDDERELTAAQERLTRAKVAMEGIEATAIFLAQNEAELEVQREHVEELALLEKAYGRDGIPALIVETSAIPEIEREASRILADLGTPYRVELRSVRELKGGGHADALDIVVIVEGATVRPYETFSGGERTRINLALRISLARLLARRAGGSRLLVIDEPEFLDEPGTIALADVLRELSDFDRIYLVSHVPTLRHAFDQTIEVVKDEAGSRIVTADVAEAVAA